MSATTTLLRLLADVSRAMAPVHYWPEGSPARHVEDQVGDAVTEALSECGLTLPGHPLDMSWEEVESWAKAKILEGA